MEQSTVPAPVVELDGDEMTRISWRFVRKEPILPPATPSLTTDESLGDLDSNLRVQGAT